MYEIPQFRWPHHYTGKGPQPPNFSWPRETIDVLECARQGNDGDAKLLAHRMGTRIYWDASRNGCARNPHGFRWHIYDDRRDVPCWTSFSAKGGALWLVINLLTPAYERCIDRLKATKQESDVVIVKKRLRLLNSPAHIRSVLKLTRALMTRTKKEAEELLLSASNSHQQSPVKGHML